MSGLTYSVGQTYGGVTTLFGAFTFWYLPDSPASAHFLSKEEKSIAIKRIAANNVGFDTFFFLWPDYIQILTRSHFQTGTKNAKFKIEQVKEAFVDPKIYIIFIASIAAQIPNGVVSNFSSISKSRDASVSSLMLTSAWL